MLITAVTLQFLSATRLLASWTGVAGYVSWIFVDGRQLNTPRYLTGTAKSVDVAVTDPFCLEIHECAEGEVPEAITEELTRKPAVWWSSKADALRYTAYRKANLAATEGILGSAAHQNGRPYYELRPQADLRAAGGVWNLFRVEAKSARGVESVRAAWPFFIEGLPAPAISCAVAGAGGVFALTLGV